MMRRAAELIAAAGPAPASFTARAMQAGREAGNASMRYHGRTEWSDEDYATANLARDLASLVDRTAPELTQKIITSALTSFLADHGMRLSDKTVLPGGAWYDDYAAFDLAGFYSQNDRNALLELLTDLAKRHNWQHVAVTLVPRGMSVTLSRRPDITTSTRAMPL